MFLGDGLMGPANALTICGRFAGALGLATACFLVQSARLTPDPLPLAGSGPYGYGRPNARDAMPEGGRVVIGVKAMPGITGTELLSRALGVRPDLMAILASGFADLSADLPPGVLRLAKPFDRAALDRAIGEALATRGTTTRPVQA